MSWATLAIGWGLGVLTGLAAIGVMAWADTSPGGEG